MIEEKKKESGEISRREFLKDAGLVVGGAAIGSTVLLAACTGEEATKTVTSTATTTVTETTSKFICPYDSQEFNTLTALQAHFATEHPAEVITYPLSQGYLVYDSKKCCGCRSCMLACSLVHEGVENLSLSRIQNLANGLGTFPDDNDIAVCRQCVYPACVESCAFDSLYVDENGIRRIDEAKCTGCQLCIDACPYVPHRTIWNPAKTNALGAKGVAAKCDLCADAPYWSETGGVNGKQACVEICPLEALKFAKVIPSQRDIKGYDVNLRNENTATIGLSPDFQRYMEQRTMIMYKNTSYKFVRRF